MKAPTLKQPRTIGKNRHVNKARQERWLKHRLTYQELGYQANRILCDAMKNPGVVVKPCPHCPGATIENITVYRDPFPPIKVSLSHRCPYLMYGPAWGWGQWTEEPLPPDLMHELVYGPSLWRIA